MFRVGYNSITNCILLYGINVVCEKERSTYEREGKLYHGHITSTATSTNIQLRVEKR